MTSTTARTPLVRVLRFDVVQRVTHWLNAALFSVLILTAISLFYGSFFGVVVPRHLDQEVHLWCGLLLPVPIAVSLLGPWGAAMRRDLKRVSYWTHHELAWLRSFGRRPLNADKFNPGQKLNTIFTGAAIVIMLASGVILQWFRFFPLSWRAGATFVHDGLAYLVVAVIIGHIVMALTHGASLRSIFSGHVDATWARTHAPSWAKELDDEAVDTASKYSVGVRQRRVPLPRNPSCGWCTTALAARTGHETRGSTFRSVVSSSTTTNYEGCTRADY